MNLSQVVEDLVFDKGLEKEQVLEIVKGGIQASYEKKFPDYEIFVDLDESCNVVVFVNAKVTSGAASDLNEISLRKAKTINSKVSVGDSIKIPFEGKIGRIEIQVAKRLISTGVSKLEQSSIYKAFKDRVGSLITGTIHKRERSGYSVNLGEAIGFLPNSCSSLKGQLKNGDQIRAVVKEVLEYTETGYQIVLDRSGAQFVLKLLELEIPEIFEGIVDVLKIERVSGYKTKVVVSSNSKNVDPVGACIGVGGSRIKPILNEVGFEKIDMIPWTENKELFIKNSLKPAEISRVEISPDETHADVWLDEDQKSFAIGKQGGNILLASKISGFEIQIHENAVENELFSEESSDQKVFDDQEESGLEDSDEFVDNENK